MHAFGLSSAYAGGLTDVLVMALLPDAYVNPPLRVTSVTANVAGVVTDLAMLAVATAGQLPSAPVVHVPVEAAAPLQANATTAPAAGALAVFWIVGIADAFHFDVPTLVEEMAMAETCSSQLSEQAVPPPPPPPAPVLVPGWGVRGGVGWRGNWGREENVRDGVAALNGHAAPILSL